MNKLKMTGFLAALSLVGLIALSPRAALARGGGGFHGGGFHGGGFHGGGFHGGGFVGGGFHGGPAAHFVGPRFGGPYHGYTGPRFGVVGRGYHPFVGASVYGPGYWGWRGGLRVWFGPSYPAPGWSWVPAHWEWNGATWAWQEGYWAPPAY